jgi:hypothetical protein
MGFQKTIFNQQGAGIAGELATDVTPIVQTLDLNSASADNNVFGRAFSLESEGNAQAGGAGAFVGFMINPKEHFSFGTALGTLEPSLTIPNGTGAGFCTFGQIYVKLPATAAIGDQVVYLEADGTLQTVAQGVALPANTQTAYAIVTHLIPAQQDPNDGEYLAIVDINHSPVRPV